MNAAWAEAPSLFHGASMIHGFLRCGFNVKLKQRTPIGSVYVLVETLSVAHGPRIEHRVVYWTGGGAEAHFVDQESAKVMFCESRLFKTASVVATAL
ncbi:uncharacterized protein V6R79_001678 [Siganus canaliculatus]